MHPAIKVWHNQPLPFVLFTSQLRSVIGNALPVQRAPGTGVLDCPKERVDPEQFKSTVDALADKVFVMYMYNWGEPLLTATSRNS